MRNGSPRVLSSGASAPAAIALVAGTLCAWLVASSPGCVPTTTAVVYAVTPAEVLVPTDSVYIKGRNLDGDNILVWLRDPSEPGASLPSVSILERKPHSLRLAIPALGTSRKRYRVVVSQNGAVARETVPGKSSYAYIGQGGVPPSEKIRIQYIHWGWVLNCRDGGGYLLHGTSRRNSGVRENGDCSTFAISGGFPNDYPDFDPGIWPQAGVDDPSEDIWPEWTRLADQTSRDWTTFCSEAWNPDGGHRVGGLEEIAPKVTLIHDLMYWFDVGSIEVPTLQTRGLRAHRIYAIDRCPQEWASCTNPQGFPGNYDASQQRKWYGCDDLYRNDDTLMNEQPACDHWPDLRSDHDGTVISYSSRLPRLEVHVVGVFYVNKVPVDPRDVTGFRAVANPSNHPDTAHVIMISDNQDVTGRANPDELDLVGFPGSIVPWPPGDGDVSNLVGEAQRGWWGPSEHRDTTPNLLSHEILHALTGLPDSAAASDTPLVQIDRDECPTTSDPILCEELAERRGYSMLFPGGTVDQACALVTSSNLTE